VDGGGSKEVGWSIVQGTGTLEVDQTTVNLTPSDNSATVTATTNYAYNGTITATSSNTSVATVEVSQLSHGKSSITVMGGSTSGTATITVSVSDDTKGNFSTPTDVTFTVNYTARTAIANLPTQSNTLTYSGEAQSPEWSNYDSSQLTIGGTTSATDAGTYTATFTPTPSYCWSDGSTETKEVTWSIGNLGSSPNLVGRYYFNLYYSNPAYADLYYRAITNDSSIVLAMANGDSMDWVFDYSGDGTLSYSINDDDFYNYFTVSLTKIDSYTESDSGWFTSLTNGYQLTITALQTIPDNASFTLSVSTSETNTYASDTVTMTFNQQTGTTTELSGKYYSSGMIYQWLPGMGGVDIPEPVPDPGIEESTTT
jgi:hypothetical protein